MKIKKYNVSDVKDALKLIKKDLGDEAVILQTRKYKKGGFLGLGSKTMYEITAVAEDIKQERVTYEKKEERKEENWIDSEKLYALKNILSKNIEKQQNYSSGKGIEPSTPQINSSRSTPSTTYSKSADATRNTQLEDRNSSYTFGNKTLNDDREQGTLKKEILGMKRMLLELNDKMQSQNYLPGIPERFRKIFVSLRNQEINEEFSKKMVESLRIVTTEGIENTMELEKKFIDILSPVIKTENPLRLHEKGDIMFFVGPTGVGKTTTLTKIAAMLSLEMRKKIAILTIDTYRIAAVEQLKTSADIMGIQVGVSYSPKELLSMLEKFKNYDLILVDTAGRSQNNEMHMSELSRYLEIIKPKYVMLTGGMNTRMKDLFDIVEHFSVVSPSHLILTKMDETKVLGSIIEVCNNYDLPISFVTNGQRIPEDIMVADPKRLASILVKEVLKDARSN